MKFGEGVVCPILSLVSNHDCNRVGKKKQNGARKYAKNSPRYRGPSCAIINLISILSSQFNS